MSNIFRAYDVRGVYPDELNEEIAGKIAAAAVKFLNAKKLVVGEDARISSPTIRDKVLRGIVAAGCDVHYIGRCTTPLFYFSVNNLDVDGGIMITASHNPPEYNGLKIVGKKSKPISGDSGLKEIEKLIEIKPIKPRGPLAFTGKLSGLRKSIGLAKSLIKEISLNKEYVDFLLSESKDIPDNGKDLKIVIDASNGMTPLVLNELLPRTKLNVSPLYFQIDGTFPNHLSDTSREENLKDLKDKVIAEKTDVGIAFDGDGDRMAVVDEKGNIVRADIVAGLIYKHFYDGDRVVYDSRFSRAVRDIFGASGIATRTGHSFGKTAMKQNDAAFGGELSGHFFFKEMLYADAAILAMLRLVEMLATENKPLSQLVAPLLIYANSGEINIPLPITNQYEYTNLQIKILEMLKNKYRDGKQSFLDGITVEYWDPDAPVGTGWWFNVRFSNTEPIVRVVVEADTQELMEEKVKEITQLLQ
ncbi:MAG: phosphomannomutase/phosphoglucomutase [Candidatus Yanofskybacteria bacterium]|nr:phosphomannomutase/phosphoglucomutase [Candidatus Yanofskybacteria bacterium]